MVSVCTGCSIGFNIVFFRYLINLYPSNDRKTFCTKSGIVVKNGMHMFNCFPVIRMCCKKYRHKNLVNYIKSDNILCCICQTTVHVN